MRRLSHNVILYLVALTFFIEMLDSSIVVTAIPTMANYFNTNIANINFTITAYVSSIAIFLTITPWLSSRIGDKRMFIAGIFIFAVSSLFCGLSDNIYEFFIFEIIQGFGAAIMVPIGRSIVLKNTPKDRYLKAISVMVWPGLIAPVIAPILGAWITQNYSWQWMFYINIPICIFAIIIAILNIPKSFINNYKKPKFDYVGCISFMVVIITLIIFMHSYVNESSMQMYRYIVLALFIIISIFLVKHLKNNSNAIIDISCFNISSFRRSISSFIFFLITTGALPFILPLYFQVKLGISLVESASLLFYLFAGNILMKFFTTYILKKYSASKILLTFSIIQVLSLIMLGLIPLYMHYILVLTLFICGISRSMLFTTYMSLIFKDMPKNKISHANAINNILFQLTCGMGVAISAVFLSISHIFTAITILSIYQIVILMLAVVSSIPIIFIIKNIKIFSLLKSKP